MAGIGLVLMNWPVFWVGIALLPVSLVVGKVMLLSLSFDHRLIDGHIGAAFAYEIIRYLENPDLLLLDA